MTNDKPPIGLKPQFIHIQERIDQISSAMNRYEEANLSVPEEWLLEVVELIIAKKKIKDKELTELAEFSELSMIQVRLGIISSDDAKIQYQDLIDSFNYGSAK